MQDKHSVGYTTHKAEMGKYPWNKALERLWNIKFNSGHPHHKKMNSAGTDAKSHLRKHTLPEQGDNGSGVPK